MFKAQKLNESIDYQNSDVGFGEIRVVDLEKDITPFCAACSFDFDAVGVLGLGVATEPVDFSDAYAAAGFGHGPVGNGTAADRTGGGVNAPSQDRRVLLAV